MSSCSLKGGQALALLLTAPSHKHRPLTSYLPHRFNPGCAQEAWRSLPELTAIEDRCVPPESNGNHEKE